MICENISIYIYTYTYHFYLYMYTCMCTCVKPLIYIEHEYKHLVKTNTNEPISIGEEHNEPSTKEDDDEGPSSPQAKDPL